MTDTISPEQVLKELHGISIPPQPQILVDIQMEQVMPHPDIRRISELISHDPGLSGTMLKVVNSAHFGLKNRIASIHQAVQLLGLSMVVNILNGISIRSEMSDDTIIALGRFWETADAIAHVAASLAKQLGIRSPDEAYALGLFHNCGVPLLLRRFPNYMEILENSYAAHDQRIIDVENAQLNTHHAVVGYFVARAWHLPTHLSQIIAEHHDVESIFLLNDPYPAEKKSLLAILKMAEHICGNYQLLGRQSVDYEWELIAPSLLNYIGLTQDDFDNLCEDFAEMDA